MTDLWLLRHGQTNWNLLGRWQGQSPQAPGLNDAGRAQVQAVYRQLNELRFSAIYSSDLLRSRQTAELVAERLGLPITLEPRLREINLGAWEGMLLTEIEAQYPFELVERARDPLHARAPQGESPLNVVERVVAFAHEIAKKHVNQSVLIVAHGISLAVIMCSAQGIPLHEIYDHILDNAQLQHTEWN